MKRWIGCLLIGLTIAMFCWAGPLSAQVTLEVLNPRGELPALKAAALSPRVPELAGKRIALVANYKAGAELFLTKVEDLLKKKYPTATFPRFKIEHQRKADPKIYSDIADKCDVFIHSTGD